MAEMLPKRVGNEKPRRNGRPQVLAFQFGGQSSKGLPPGGEWRRMRVDNIMSVVARNGQWFTGDRHTRPQTCVDQIDLEVAY